MANALIEASSEARLENGLFLIMTFLAANALFSCEFVADSNPLYSHYVHIFNYNMMLYVYSKQNV